MHIALTDAHPPVSRDKLQACEFVASLSPAMKAVEQAVAEVSAGRMPVLIAGESGSGKHKLAYRLHELSCHQHEHLKEVDCSQLLPEAVLGIAGVTNGEAVTGTLLLTQVAELPAGCQPLLLNWWMQQQDSGKPCPRVVALTQRNLEQELRAGRFREDLYYRLAGVCLRVPPLRFRREDIPLLADHFLRKYSALFGRPESLLSDKMRRFLVEHAWPGNVRELEAAVKTIAAIGDERIAIAALRSASMKGVQIGAQESTSLREASRAASRQAEREIILRVLSRTRWNRKRAAEELQISYKALLYKLKQIGMTERFGLPPGEEL